MSIETISKNGEALRLAKAGKWSAYGITTLEAITRVLRLIRLDEWVKSI